MEYNVLAIFDPDADLTDIKKAIVEVMNDRFGDKSKWPNVWRNPIRKCEEKQTGGTFPNGMMAGGHFMNLKTTRKPGLVDQDLKDIISAEDFYSGCYAKASISAFSYDRAGNRGVSFGLQNLQKTADGEKLTKQPRPQDEFTPVKRDSTDSLDDLM